MVVFFLSHFECAAIEIVLGSEGKMHLRTHASTFLYRALSEINEAPQYYNMHKRMNKQTYTYKSTTKLLNTRKIRNEFIVRLFPIQLGFETVVFSPSSLVLSSLSLNSFAFFSFLFSTMVFFFGPLLLSAGSGIDAFC